MVASTSTTPATIVLDREHRVAAVFLRALLASAGVTLLHNTGGEIVVRGPMVFNGYWNCEADNAFTFRGGWHHTGDMGRFDADGRAARMVLLNDVTEPRRLQGELAAAMAARATVISSGDNEDYAHPRARVLGASARYGRESRAPGGELLPPLIYSTELARSVGLDFAAHAQAHQERAHL